MKEVRILDKKFRELISEQAIQKRVGEIALQINRDFVGSEVIFVGILNGAFMFAADLFRKIDLTARITFVKLASYQGTSSTGTIMELIGWNEDLVNKNIVVIEDIVDTGATLERIVNELVIRNVAGIKIATMLLKPTAYTRDIPIDYIGFEIPNNFVVGYGLDYNGFGRNLSEVYTLVR
ncbi:MAG: hypoxanthine phosphoribosyltransferase [Bacteroidales bacterium]|nr:hypoxanthine phosphoribosyltransferase [Bacteroidales bacterium]